MLKKGDKIEFLQTYNFTKLKTAYKYGNLKVIRGFVLDMNDNFIIVQTKNYKECFRWDEVDKHIFKRGELNAKLKRLIEN